MKYNPNQDAVAANLAVGAAEVSASNPVPVASISRELVVDSNTLVAQKTVTTTAASLFAGSDILAERDYLEISPIGGTVYWGLTSSVTTSTGKPVFVGSSEIIGFDYAGNGADVAIYVIAAGSYAVAVREGKRVS